jgi:hypothetical protein
MRVDEDVGIRARKGEGARLIKKRLHAPARGLNKARSLGQPRRIEILSAQDKYVRGRAKPQKKPHDPLKRAWAPSEGHKRVFIEGCRVDYTDGTHIPPHYRPARPLS